MCFFSYQFVRHVIQASSMIISSCVQDHCDLFMTLHPDTEIDACLRPYFKNPDVVVQAATRLSWIQFTPYLALRDPMTVESPEDVCLYLGLLGSAVNKPQLMAIHLGIMIDAAEILGTLRLLCMTRSNRDVLLSSNIFPRAISPVLSCDKQDALVGSLNLLLCLLSPLMDDFKSKLDDKKTSQKRESKKISRLEKWSCKYDWWSKLVSKVPDLSARLRPLLSSRQEEVGNLASALAWVLETDISKIGE